ncbi:MAG: acetyl-CoA carboxylase, biotin carboxyl carrier protein [Hyphomicrobiales bacterium]|nr:MAG: acetyl-CoA carboxylase, biotin carboxyl carrier protein [Hyphomicrobiales bacterium]
MPLKQSDIEALVDLFSQSGWDEMHLEIDGEELFLSHDSRALGGASTAPVPAAVGAAVGAFAATPASPSPIAPSGTVPGASAAARPSHWVVVKAPNLGTFYRAPAPDAAPYVALGAAVTPETELCLIEVMKLFTTVRAGMSGVVREIVARDGEMVEYGAELFWIEPA